MKKIIKNIYLKITGNYILKNKIGNVEKYEKIFNETLKYPLSADLEEFFFKKNFASEFINNLAYLTQVTIKKSRIDFNHGKVIYVVLKDYLRTLKDVKNIKLVDIGTARGFSSLIMSKVLDELQIDAKIYTFDIIPNNKKIFWNCFADHIFGKQTRFELLKDYRNLLKNINFLTGQSFEQLNKLKLERINFAFIDGSHEYEDVKKDYLQISKKQTKDDLILFDDYTNNFFNGVVKLVDQVEKDKMYEVKRIISSDQRGYALARKL